MSIDTQPEFTREELADLRWNLQTFAEDWLAPEMDVYDEY